MYYRGLKNYNIKQIINKIINKSFCLGTTTFSVRQNLLLYVGQRINGGTEVRAEHINTLKYRFLHF